MEYSTIFNDELAQAKQFELKTKALYEALGYTVELMSNTSSERKFWDLKITKHNTSKYVEVKFDQMCVIGRDNKTGSGQLYFEFESRGNKSGLATTKADIWVHWITEDKYVVFTDLKRLRKELRSIKMVSGGDNNTSQGKLLALKDLTRFLGSYDDEQQVYQLSVS